jgi:hypothetical protein
MPVQPIYVNGALVTYNTATGTIAPTTGLQLDGKGNVTAALPETAINISSVSGLYLVTIYIRIVTPSTGGAAPSSTLGPAATYFTCADCDIPVTLVTGLLLQDGTLSATNSANAANTCLSGSVIVNALAGEPISISLGYASSGAGSGGKVDVTASGGAITGFLTWIPVGSGYTVGDILQVVGGNNDAVLTVTSVNGSGQPTGATVTTPGTGYSNYTTYNLVESSAMAPMVYNYHIRSVFLGGLPS